MLKILRHVQLQFTNFVLILIKIVIDFFLLNNLIKSLNFKQERKMVDLIELSGKTFR